jgi:hypothetical protein
MFALFTNLHVSLYFLYNPGYKIFLFEILHVIKTNIIYLGISIRLQNVVF